eukprot:1271660-Alexandrium_andersonii.AAC.1
MCIRDRSPAAAWAAAAPVPGTTPAAAWAAGPQGQGPALPGEKPGCAGKAALAEAWATARQRRRTAPAARR